MRTYTEFHPDGPPIAHADSFKKPSGGSFVYLTIGDKEESTISHSHIGLYLRSPEDLIALGRQIEAEGIRLQASKPIPPVAADPDDDDDEADTPLVPAAVTTEEAALPL